MRPAAKRTRWLAWVGIVLAGCAGSSSPPSAVPGAPAADGAATTPGAGAGLIVEVAGIESDRGQVAFALFDDEATFAAGEDPLRRAVLPARAGATVWSVDGLPPGRYAIKAYHDVNANGQLDFNAFGAPAEPFGFSNDARRRFSSPTFDEAAFALEPTGASIALTVR